MAGLSAQKGTEKAKGGIRSRSIAEEGINPDRLVRACLDGTYLDYAGKGQPTLLLEDLSAVASGADATGHIALLPHGGILGYTPIGAIAATVKGPVAHATGLNLAFDAFATDGGNFVPGGGLLGNPFALTVERTAGAVVPVGKFLRFRFVIEDVSGTADFAFGWRKSEAVQAAIDNYDEMAAYNLISGALKTETILNNAATATSGTLATVADGEEHEALIVCHGNGKVRFYWDGSPLGKTTFQFDDAEVVVPFIYLLQATDLTSVYLKRLQVGDVSLLTGKDFSKVA